MAIIHNEYRQHLVTISLFFAYSICELGTEMSFTGELRMHLRNALLTLVWWDVDLDFEVVPLPYIILGNKLPRPWTHYMLMQKPCKPMPKPKFKSRLFHFIGYTPAPNATLERYK